MNNNDLSHKEIIFICLNCPLKLSQLQGEKISFLPTGSCLSKRLILLSCPFRSNILFQRVEVKCTHCHNRFVDSSSSSLGVVPGQHWVSCTRHLAISNSANYSTSGIQQRTLGYIMENSTASQYILGMSSLVR